VFIHEHVYLNVPFDVIINPVSKHPPLPANPVGAPELLIGCISPDLPNQNKDI
jgi:hypothetical protein